ncbi:MAG TPA: hypothetical protein VGD67_24610 [Pseudonocardiaceae bacterium]
MPFFSGVGEPVGAVIGAAAGAAAGAGAAAAAQAAASSSGRLRIEPDQVDGAITVFRNALANVEAEVAQARSDITAFAPAGDAVSNDVASAFNEVGTTNALAAWEGAIEQLRSIIEQLEAAKQQHLTTDAGNAGMLQQPSA